MAEILFTSILNSSYKDELERQLFFNQNQEKVRSDIVLLIKRYGMAHVRTFDDHLRVILDASPEPQTLFVLQPADDEDQLVGVMVYLREGDTLSLIIAAVYENYAGVPLLRKMIDELCNIARRVKGIKSVTLFPGTHREGKVLIA